MKTKLYRRFVKKVIAALGITRKQLFSRDFKSCIMSPHVFDVMTHKLTKDTSSLIVLGHKHPLSQIWKSYDFHPRWLLKYWKHSRHKAYVQMKLDLGYKLEEIILDVLSNRPKSKI